MMEIKSDIIQKRLRESELFSKKFGTFSKSDYEVLMFTMYLDSLTEYVRDYDISISLGIPESKVRSLRVKSQLLYPREIKWIQEIGSAINHGYYDSNSGQITITVENPSVRNYLRYIIEKNFGVVGLTLNSKQLVLPIESYMLLATLAEEDADQMILKLNKLIQDELKIKDRIEKKSFARRFLKGIPNLVGFVSASLDIYKNGRPIIEALINTIT